MGTSTDADIAYGIDLGDDLYEMPWVSEDTEDDGDIEKWWLRECGYKDLYDDLWTEEGDYGEGYTNEKNKENYAHKTKFMESHPCPVELHIHCSYDCPMYILAVKETTMSASRGYAVEFSPEDLKFKDEDKVAFDNFIKKYKIEGKPTWLLYSLWG